MLLYEYTVTFIHFLIEVWAWEQLLLYITSYWDGLLYSLIMQYLTNTQGMYTNFIKYCQIASQQYQFYSPLIASWHTGQILVLVDG